MEKERIITVEEIKDAHSLWINCSQKELHIKEFDALK